MALEARFTKQLVMLTSEPQREWLEAVADQRKCSIAEVVREAIDAKMEAEA